jgi:PncC family amidohydrolase
VDSILHLARQINDRLKDVGTPTIAAAESCSGGGVASAITTYSGSSAYFMGSIVAYVNDAKANLLGVSQHILEERGAVSPECAEAMAQGARAMFGTDIGVSTTGIAGPTGATARKPVGLVYAAIASDHGTRIEEHRFDGDRMAITHAAIEAALRMLITELERFTESTASD